MSLREERREVQATTPDHRRARPALGVRARIPDGARPVVFVAASLIVHALLSWVMPETVSSSGGEPEPPSFVAFDLERPAPEPEPEPVEEIEPVEETEPVEPPEQEPVQREPVQREPEPTEPAPVEQEQVDEDAQEREQDEPADDGEAEGERQTVDSTEGGLAVGLPEGPGGGGHGSGDRGDGSGSGRGAMQPAPAPKPKVDLRALTQKYMLRVARLLRRNHHYPLAARRARHEGTVQLAITITPDGSIRGVEIARSSGHDTLDGAAKQTVRDLDGVPAPPKALHWRTRAVKLPIAYRLD